LAQVLTAEMRREFEVRGRDLAQAVRTEIRGESEAAVRDVAHSITTGIRGKFEIGVLDLRNWLDSSSAQIAATKEAAAALREELAAAQACTTGVLQKLQDELSLLREQSDLAADTHAAREADWLARQQVLRDELAR